MRFINYEKEIKDLVRKIEGFNIGGEGEATEIKRVFHKTKGGRQ